MKKIWIVIIAALCVMGLGVFSATAGIDFGALIKNADSAIAKVKSSAGGNIGGINLGQKVAGIGDAGTIASLKSYEQYISQALAWIESNKQKGAPVADSVAALQTSNQKNMGILEGLLKKPELSQGVKAAIGSAIDKIKQVQQKLQGLKK